MDKTFISIEKKMKKFLQLKIVAQNRLVNENNKYHHIIKLIQLGKTKTSKPAKLQKLDQKASQMKRIHKHLHAKFAYALKLFDKYSSVNND